MSEQAETEIVKVPEGRPRFLRETIQNAASNFFWQGHLSLTDAHTKETLTDFKDLNVQELDIFAHSLFAIFPPNCTSRETIGLIFSKRKRLMDFLEHYLDLYKAGHTQFEDLAIDAYSDTNNEIRSARDRQRGRDLIYNLLSTYKFLQTIPSARRFVDETNRKANTPLAITIELQDRISAVINAISLPLVDHWDHCDDMEEKITPQIRRDVLRICQLKVQFDGLSYIPGIRTAVSSAQRAIDELQGEIEKNVLVSLFNRDGT